MFLEMSEPEVVDIYRTRDRTMIRVREKNAPGRLWFNMAFKNDEDAMKFVEGCNFELKKKGPKE